MNAEKPLGMPAANYLNLFDKSEFSSNFDTLNANTASTNPALASSNNELDNKQAPNRGLGFSGSTDIKKKLALHLFCFYFNYFF